MENGLNVLIIAPMILLASPVTPIKRKMIPTMSCRAIRLCVLAGPCSDRVRNAVTSGMAGVIQPGTTGSPSIACIL